MQKMILTLGLLVCGSVAYGMDKNKREQINATDMKAAIDESCWLGVAIILQRPCNTQAKNLLYNTNAAILNTYSAEKGSLIGALMYHHDNNGDACGQTLVHLIRNGKLNLEAKDAEGNLLLDDKNIHHKNKTRFIATLEEHKIKHQPISMSNSNAGEYDYSFIYQKAQTPAATICTPMPKRTLPYTSFLSVTTTYELCIAAAGIALAVIGIYKWSTRKKKTTNRVRKKPPMNLKKILMKKQKKQMSK